MVVPEDFSSIYKNSILPVLEENWNENTAHTLDKNASPNVHIFWILLHFPPWALVLPLSFFISKFIPFFFFLFVFYNIFLSSFVSFFFFFSFMLIFLWYFFFFIFSFLTCFFFFPEWFFLFIYFFYLQLKKKKGERSLG